MLMGKFYKRNNQLLAQYGANSLSAFMAAIEWENRSIAAIKISRNNRADDYSSEDCATAMLFCGARCIKVKISVNIVLL